VAGGWNAANDLHRAIVAMVVAMVVAMLAGPPGTLLLPRRRLVLVALGGGFNRR
jgi:hypothetical protein